MVIASVGYAGTVDEVQWARMVPRVGAGVMSVNDFESFRVTAAAGTRTVRVAPGAASAYGIFDTSDAAVNVVLGDVTSGVRYDLIALRRTWATKTTSIVAIPGGATKALPSRNTSPGVVYDQPLALARVAAGSSLIQEIVDLRVAVANGGAVAWDDLVRSYLTDLGTVLRIGNTQWTRTVDGNGSPAWAQDDVTPDTGWVEVARNDGWSWTVGQVRRIGRTIYLRVMAARAAGWSQGGGVALLPVGFRPDMDWYVNSSAVGKSEFLIRPDGNVLAWQASNGATAVTLHTSYPAARS